MDQQKFKEEIESLISLYLEDDFREIYVAYMVDEYDELTADIIMEDIVGRKFEIPVVWGEQAIGHKDNKPIMGACIDIGDAGVLEFSAYEAYRYLFHVEAEKRQA